MEWVNSLALKHHESSLAFLQLSPTVPRCAVGQASRAENNLQEKEKGTIPISQMSPMSHCQNRHNPPMLQQSLGKGKATILDLDQ